MPNFTQSSSLINIRCTLAGSRYFGMKLYNFFKNLFPFAALWIGLMAVFAALPAHSQTYDTISNWDGITTSWNYSAGSGQVIPNPAPDAVNASAHCLKVITTVSMWDNISCVLPSPANFDAYPRYRLKVYAPSTGGDVTFKFQNQDNSYFHEITATPTPGEWSDLTFDFSNLEFQNLTQLVIFYDFHGTANGKFWYFDDILKEIPPPFELMSNLPIVVINTYGNAIPDEPKVTAHMGIVYNGPGQVNHTADLFNHFNGMIGIETRGQSTQMFPKKSYAFETRDSDGGNLDVSLLGMPAENDWILYAPYTDKSLMRNAVTFELVRRTGHYVTRTMWCEVIVNNNYKGIYVLEEKIKKDENRVDIATLKPDEISGDDLTGGYILRVDKRDPDFSFSTDGWQSNPVPPYPNAMDIIFQYYYPEAGEIVAEQRNYIKGFVTQAENALTSPGFSDPATGYQRYLDVASFIDFMLICEIAKEVDKYRYSTYFFKKKDSDGGKLFAGPAWDFNLGYGNVDYWPPGLAVSGWLYEMVEPYEWSIMFWWKRLMEDPYFKGMAKLRWHTLRENKLSDSSVQAVIDSLVNHTESARERNFERWPILGQYVWPNYDWYNNTYQDELNNFRTFLFNRMSWMDNNFQGEAMHPGMTITPLANTLKVKLYGDYFANSLLEKSHFTLNAAPASLSIQSITYVDPNECVLTLTANVSQLSQLSVTLDEKAINSWEDLTSNTVGTAGLEKVDADLLKIKVHFDGGLLSLHCNYVNELGSTARVVDVSGQYISMLPLEKLSLQHWSLDLKAGVYLLQLETKTGIMTKKFLVN